MFIYILIKKQVWAEVKKLGQYSPPSLTKEGFIHASTFKQILQTANRKFSSELELLVLKINTQKISAEIKFELSKSTGEKHPHIFGVLPISVVESVYKIKPNEEGVFESLPFSE